MTEPVTDEPITDGSLDEHSPALAENLGTLERRERRERDEREQARLASLRERARYD
ncbi:MAG: hypothetical protein NT013_29460 [Planctomycetia bacterium]|nr:hypothetical protein [Planctomycetia bacterium]